MLLYIQPVLYSLPLVLRPVRPDHAAGPVLPLSVKLPLVKRTVCEAEETMAVPQAVLPLAVVHLVVVSLWYFDMFQFSYAGREKKYTT